MALKPNSPCGPVEQESSIRIVSQAKGNDDYRLDLAAGRRFRERGIDFTPRLTARTSKAHAPFARQKDACPCP
jgi:hypothetical protein